MSFEMPITGTHIWYYFVCKREVWLLIHQIAADQDHEDLDYGRFISEQRYRRDKKEISIGNIVVDRLRTENGQLIVGEVKKSSKFKKSAKMQLLYYLDNLRKMGIEAKGELLFPEERKKEVVEWSVEGIEELKKAMEDIRKIARLPVPPNPEKIPFCRKCAYKEYCWAEG
ncbi:CRISPR-associated protein Cas4 [Bacillus sp. FJAT-47783]|uniref:CRISPR-associated protein Cas4 n=1 Tax=Bacillus sp. FJAT-47783 TaxID=2922712 RepID=UPI001FAC5D3E|nr:CRISPR-associated protein Cas4 [Bacillus sp. FJAT-47783]